MKCKLTSLIGLEHRARVLYDVVSGTPNECAFVTLDHSGWVQVYFPRCFYTFFTTCTTSSSSSGWSLPTRCGWCFTDEPHTHAYL